jgi:hypothetical protein
VFLRLRLYNVAQPLCKAPISGIIMLSRAALLLTAYTTAALTSSTADSSTTSTGSAGIGDYVASGVGLTSTSAGSSTSSSSSAPNVTGFLDASSSVTSSTKFYYAGNSTTGPTGATTAASGNVTAWASAANADACWTEWSSYWDRNSTEPSYSRSTTGYSTYVVSEVSIVYSTLTNIESVVTNSEYTYTEIFTEMDGYYTEGTVTLTTVYPATTNTIYSVSAESTVTTPEATQTEPLVEVWTITSGLPDLSLIPTITPPCQLPSSYSRCQTSWEDWISTMVVPSPMPPARG